MTGFFIIFLSLNTLAAAYLGIRTYFMFSGLLPYFLQNKFIYALMVLFLSQFYVILRVMYRSAHDVPQAGLYYFASTTLGIYMITLSLMIVFDLLILFFWSTKSILPIYSYISKHTAHVGILYLFLVVILYVLGLFNANISRNTLYELALNKDIKDFRIVQISDIHVTSYSTVKGMEGLVNKINGLNADLVLFTGDMIDGEQKPYIELGVPGIFKRINSRHGIYGVLGNHEYYGEGIERAMRLLSASGITMLRDESVYIPELNVTLIGRDDLGAYRISGKERATAEQLSEGVNASSGAVIVMDHQPQRAYEFYETADLQLSGHTHNGQIWPASLIVKLIYDNPWGLSSYSAMKLIVSCGYGTWGPPIRIGSHSEIVVIDIKPSKS